MQQTKDPKESKDKVRVFALARTLGVDSKTVIDLCKSLGFEVKSQLAGLEPEQADLVKQRLAKGAKSAPVEPSRAATSAPPLPKDKKIVSLPPTKTPPKPLEKPRVETLKPVEPELEPIVPAVIAEAPIAEVPPPPASLAPPPLETKPIPPKPATRIPTLTGPKTPTRERETVARAATPPVTEEVAPPPPTRIVEPHSPSIAIVAPPAPPLVAPPAPAVVETPRPAPVVPQAPVAPEAPSIAAETPTPEVEVLAPAPTVPAVPTPPAKLPTVTPRLPTLAARPPSLGSRGGSAPPRRPDSPATGTGKPTSAPPPFRPGVTPPPTSRTPTSTHGHGIRPGGGAASPPAAPGTAGTAGPGKAADGTRHRRGDHDRRQGLQQVRQHDKDKDKKPAPPAASKKFSPEELKLLRDGTSLTELLRKRKEVIAPVPPPGTQPASGTEEEDEAAERKKKGLPGRETKTNDRVKRQEQRKVRQANIVIEGGHVDIVEDEHGRRRGKRPKALMRPKQKGTLPPKEKRILVSLPISVRSLSESIGMKVVELLLKLKALTGASPNINSTIEYDVAELIATEKDLELVLEKAKDAEEDLRRAHAETLGDDSLLQPRAPVVAVMGHVDHGKTSLLDRIRQQYGLKSDVVSTEAGGITQVIRAWRVEKEGKAVTFLDTPGHEAFTKMRARGANVTDIAVIVVAANDGVMPQTEEAINHAKAAGVSIVVAINKVDLPDANLRKTEQQLYSLGLLPDTMGGDCQFVQTSAVKGTGVDELLETLTLVAELKELKANPKKQAMGICLEAHLSGDEGVMATLLVQQGTLHRGDVVICGSAYGRVRAMYDDHGNPIIEAGPSMPVLITGLDEVPNADDHFHGVSEVSKAREIAEKRKSKAQEATFAPKQVVRMEDLTAAGKPKITELKVILKAEARGSIEAIRKELEKLVHDEVRARLLHAGIGAITESDVQLALASPEDTLVVGFNVVPDDNALRLADERGISIREYDIIYKLTEDIKSALEGKLKPREEVIHLGRAVIRETFKISRVGTIAGCYVTQGTIERNAKIRVIREGVVVFPPTDKVANLESLKHYKEDVREVKQGFECGMKLNGYDDVKVGDVIEAYRIEQVLRTL